MRIFQVDAFTRTRFAGNPTTVVLDADGLDDDSLSQVAKEFSHAETAFVRAASAADHDVHLRFFNAHGESPFVGHATIAAHAVLLALGRRGAGTCRQRSGTGVIDVFAADDAGGPIEFRQSVPDLEPPLPLKITLRVAEALRLPATQLHEAMPGRVARSGVARMLVPIGDPRALDTLSPNMDTLADLGNELGADGFFIFAPVRGPDRLSTESRMFRPALGIREDPVSGNAHAMLAAYLWDFGQLGKNSSGFTGHQGRQAGRPGEVSVRLEIERGALVAVRIAGGAVIVSEGTLAW